MGNGAFFDRAMFGRLIRLARTEKGMSNAEKFRQRIECSTGYPISESVIKNIESGRKMPNIEEVVAFSLALDGTLMGGDTENAIRLSSCRKWRDVDNETLFMFAADALEEHERLTREIEHTREWNTYIQEKLLKVQEEFETVVLSDGATDEQREEAHKAFIQKTEAIEREIDLGSGAWRALRR